MSTVLLLGPFMFATDLDPVNGIDRTTSPRIAEQELLHRVPTVQKLGPGSQTIGIEGFILPEHQGGLGQIDAMHDAADRQHIMGLATGYGRYFGTFIIKSVNEKRRYLTFGGLPRKIEFKLDLLRDPGGLGGFMGLF